MNKDSQMGEKKRKEGSEMQQKGKTEPVILPSPVAFNFPFLTVKISETNRNFSKTELKEKEKAAKALEMASHRQRYTQLCQIGTFLHKHTQGSVGFFMT